QQEYWLRHLSGAPLAMELPWDRTPAGRRSEATGLIDFTLPEHDVSGLAALGTVSGATLHMTLFAVFQVLLSLWSGHRDLLVGVAAAGRSRVETEGLIGFFVNTLAIRTDLTGDPGFEDLLTHVRDTLLTAYLNQDLPFDRLVAAV